MNECRQKLRKSQLESVIKGLKMGKLMNEKLKLFFNCSTRVHVAGINFLQFSLEIFLFATLQKIVMIIEVEPLQHAARKRKLYVNK